MKKWIVAFVGLVLSCELSASYESFTGINGGLYIGLIQGQVKNQPHSTLFLPAGFNFTFDVDSKLTDLSIMGGVTLGYGYLLRESIIVALEGRANFQDLNMKGIDTSFEAIASFTSITTTTFHVAQDYALLAKLGVSCVHQCLIYGLIGPDWGKVNTSDDIAFDLTGVLSGTSHASHSNYELGLVLGFGMEYLITPCSSLALEYNYTNYGDLDSLRSTAELIDNNGVPIAGTLVALNNELKMQTNKVFIKYNYYFRD